MVVLFSMKKPEIEQFRQELLQLQPELLAMENLSRESTISVGLDQTTVGGLSRIGA
jgi:hypothetical protein